jgi:hypothetical protein
MYVYVYMYYISMYGRMCMYGLISRPMNMYSKGYTGPVLVARKKVGLEIDSDKTKYILPFREQSAVENHNIKTANKSFAIVQC